MKFSVEKKQKKMLVLTDDACMEIARHMDTVELYRLTRVSKETARLVDEFLFSTYARSSEALLKWNTCRRQTTSRRVLLLYAAPPYLTTGYRLLRYKCITCGRRTVDVACCAFCKTE